MCDMRAKIGSSGRLLWKMSVGRKQSLRLWVAGMMMTSLLTYARPKLVGEARILDGTVSGRANGLVMGAQEAFWCDRVGSQGLVAGRTRLRMPSRRGRWSRQRGFNSTDEGRSRSRSPWAEHRQGE